MKADGTYTPEVNRNLMNGVTEFKSNNSNVFKKGGK